MAATTRRPICNPPPELEARTKQNPSDKLTVMGPFEHLVDAYRTRASLSAASRLSILMELEQGRDPRLLDFLLNVLADPQETPTVRMYVLKQLRNTRGLVAPADRPAAANGAGAALIESRNAELRIQAALTLGEFTDVDGVLSTLSAVCIAEDESIDLRYAAFTSLERAGASPECVAALRQITADEALGLLARNVLLAWHIE